MILDGKAPKFNGLGVYESRTVPIHGLRITSKEIHV
jgi:hypothetical protein